MNKKEKDLLNYYIEKSDNLMGAKRVLVTLRKELFALHESKDDNNVGGVAE